MHVFVTGGSGLIGSAVVSELLAHGHTVSALARSAASADTVRALGAQPVPGSTADLDVLRAAASEADGVASLAFDHSVDGPDSLGRSVDQERAALVSLGEALVGTDRPLVMVSGTPPIPGRLSTEADALVLEGPVLERNRTVLAALALAERGVRASAVRLPRTVHDEGRGGFAGLLTDLARQTGVAGYPGDGTQRWPAVHARDAAVLFRLALEGAAPGTAWHAVADEGDTVIDIATVIGRRLGLPVESVPQESFGPFASIFAMDQPSSSEYTRETLGWRPSHPSLLADLENIEP